MSKVLLYLRYMRISRCSLHKCQETLVLQIFSFLKLKYNYILFAFHLLPPISGKYRPHKLSQIQIFFFFIIVVIAIVSCLVYLVFCVLLVFVQVYSLSLRKFSSVVSCTYRLCHSLGILLTCLCLCFKSLVFQSYPTFPVFLICFSYSSI